MHPTNQFGSQHIKITQNIRVQNKLIYIGCSYILNHLVTDGNDYIGYMKVTLTVFHKPRISVHEKHKPEIA